VRDRDAVPQLIQSLASTDAAESREAALALGRIDDHAATAPLLASAPRASDPFHRHALAYALIQIADRAGTAKGLADRSAATRTIAVTALDQMTGGELTFQEVLPLLGADEASVRSEATAIVTKRPQWAEHVAERIRSSLAQANDDAASNQDIRGIVVAFAANEDVQRVVAAALHEPATPASTRVMLLRAIAAASPEPMPRAWLDVIAPSLAATDDAVVRQAVEVARARTVTTCDNDLVRIARDPARPPDTRIASLLAVAGRISPTADDAALLVGEFAADRPPLARLSVAQCIAAMTFADAQLLDIAPAVLAKAGPLEVNQLLQAFAKSHDARVGAAVVAALRQSKAAQSVSAEVLRETFKNYPPEVLQSAEPLLKRADADGAQRKARLAELEPLLAGGDPARGQSVFLAKTASCTTCHTIGGLGGQVGPDLSKIGGIRAGRDLLESIVFPSATIARGFESFVVETKDGGVYAGPLASESSDAIGLKTPAEVDIPRSHVKSFRPDRVSIMPQGLDAQLSPQELRDLLAFLQACK
jgi:putative heme-binding domain-containing protein